MIEPSDNAARATFLSVGEIFDDQVAHRRSDIAVQSAAGSWTYAELAEEVHRLCGFLMSRGVTAGDRVAVLSENRREYVAALIAGAKLGVAIACLNWRQSAEELAHCIGLVDPRLALVSGRHRAHADLFGSGEAHRLGPEFDARLRAFSSDPPDVPPPHPEAILSILFTSGTTGKPKGACISHRALIARGMVGLLDRVQRRGSTYVAWPPMFHMASADTSLHTLMNGGKVIVVDGGKVDELCDILAREDNLGWFNLMPGMIDRVLDEMRRRNLKPRPVDSIGTLPDLMPRHLIAEATRMFNAPFRNTYGSTETGPAPGGAGLIPIGTVPGDLAKRQSSLCWIRLVDGDGGDVAPGAPGELLVRGPTLFSGYWGMPKETAEAFAGGWYHTGDVFVRDADGGLRFVDRRKYLIKSGGENIYPAEIEQLLLESPRIDDVSVVRKRDPRWGEVPVAFVVRSDPTLTAEEVIDLCRGRIANYKLPRGVLFLHASEVPRSTTGKVMRDKLEERIARDGG